MFFRKFRMSFSLEKFLRTLALTVIIGIVLFAGLRAAGIIPGRTPAEEQPADLIRQANAGLEAVRKRKPTDRRPASYDAVLSPLDKLLRQLQNMVMDEKFDAVRDYDKVRSIALPIIDIATKADSQAKNETGFMTKEYRFNAQKSEACGHLASVLWERINRTLPPSTSYFDESPSYPPTEMRELRRILDMGIQANPENAELFYTRGVVSRAEGLFAPAARDLEQAVKLTPELAGAWNTLGLVRINLKEFDKAEEAFDRGKAAVLKQAQDFNLSDPGPEYTAILYNLATFHEGLATYYNRENRITPTVEYQGSARRHSDEARRYFREFLEREPANSPDAQAARAKMQSLP